VDLSTNEADQSLSDSHTALLQLRAGDRSALWRIADSLRPWLKHVAMGQLAGDRPCTSEDASDLVQRTLTRAVESIEDFRGSSLAEWRGWLAAIARNEARSSRRYWSAKRRASSAQVPIVSGAEPACPADSPSAVVRQAELGEQLKLAISRLAPEHQQLVRWRTGDSLSHAEIAERLQITVDAARQRCKSAMDALRRAWAQLDPPGD
jgi:RNA polymerase sigma factor (sigma-70 family)